MTKHCGEVTVKISEADIERLEALTDKIRAERDRQELIDSIYDLPLYSLAEVWESRPLRPWREGYVASVHGSEVHTKAATWEVTQVDMSTIRVTADIAAVAEDLFFDLDGKEVARFKEWLSYRLVRTEDEA